MRFKNFLNELVRLHHPRDDRASRLLRLQQIFLTKFANWRNLKTTASFHLRSLKPRIPNCSANFNACFVVPPHSLLPNIPKPLVFTKSGLPIALATSAKLNPTDTSALNPRSAPNRERTQENFSALPLLASNNYGMNLDTRTKPNGRIERQERTSRQHECFNHGLAAIQKCRRKSSLLNRRKNVR